MLEARNIHKAYNNGKKELVVLNGVDLSLDKGKFVAIVGPSGAGKSTLLHILGGLDDPTQGEVIFDNVNLYELPDNQISQVRNKRIGFVFQFYHLLSEFTVLENIMMPVLIRKVADNSESALRKEALALLDVVGLGERSDYFPSQLSGGEKQRVAIVRGLINRPSLLLCDEPTGNLDSKTGEEIISLIKKMNINNQMTVVLVTHNIDLTKQADRVYHLRDGILVN